MFEFTKRCSVKNLLFIYGSNQMNMFMAGQEVKQQSHVDLSPDANPTHRSDFYGFILHVISKDTKEI